MRVVVTGANRGIGLELVRQLLERGHAVEAATRKPEEANDLKKLGARPSARLRVHACDVNDDASVKAFAAALGEGAGVDGRSPVAGVDVLVNNAGVLGKMQSMVDLDLDDVMHTFSVNALGPIRVTRALLPLLRKSEVRKVIHVTSRMGAIHDNTSGGAYGYRMSKAALNMAMKSMSVDYRKDRIITIVINPGWVQTDMGGTQAPTPVQESVRGILEVMDNVTLEQSGTFWDYRGHTVDW